VSAPDQVGILFSILGEFSENEHLIFVILSSKLVFLV
jgi:hypothetical protein